VVWSGLGIVRVCGILSFGLCPGVSIASAVHGYCFNMFFNLHIGDYSRGDGQKEMKGTFFGEITKTINLKFHQLQLSVVKSQIVVVWRVMSNVTPLPSDKEIEKSTSERKSREGAKLLLRLKKGQQVISIGIDGTEHKEVVGIAVTIRDPRMALHMSVVTNEAGEPLRDA
jgi:hypothetical protein